MKWAIQIALAAVALSLFAVAAFNDDPSVQMGAAIVGLCVSLVGYSHADTL